MRIHRRERGRKFREAHEEAGASDASFRTSITEASLQARHPAIRSVVVSDSGEVPRHYRRSRRADPRSPGELSIPRNRFGGLNVKRLRQHHQVTNCDMRVGSMQSRGGPVNF